MIQTSLVKWLDDLVKSCLGEVSYPSVLVDHCVGTDRALGAYFCDFFAERNELTSDERLQIAQLAVICRALIVVDDAIRDEDVVGLGLNELVLLRNAFYNKCEELLSQWANDKEVAHSLLQMRGQQLEDAYSAIQNGEPPSFITVRRKCAFFEIPFDALEMKVDKSIVAQLKEQELTMLFILQMADDYADRLSDQGKPYNSNLISWGTESSLVAKQLFDDAELSAKYASLVIYSLLDRLDRISQDNIRVIAWIKAVKAIINWPGANHISILAQQIVPFLTSGNYLVPAVNKLIDDKSLTRIDALPKVLFKLSAESIHMAATKKVMVVS